MAGILTVARPRVARSNRRRIQSSQVAGIADHAERGRRVSPVTGRRRCRAAADRTATAVHLRRVDACD